MPTAVEGIPTDAQHMEAAKHQALHGVWTVLREVVSSGRLDAAGLRSADLDGFCDGVYRAVEPVFDRWFCLPEANDTLPKGGTNNGSTAQRPGEITVGAGW